MKTFEELKEAVAALEPDAKKFFEKGNSAAGTRLRKGLLNVKAKAQAVRVDVLQKRGQE